jgi:Ca2+-binding RTX toxin-like protein
VSTFVSGNDVLNGGAGNDSLYGDAQNYAPSSPGSITGGKDTLNGGGERGPRLQPRVRR